MCSLSKHSRGVLLLAKAYFCWNFDLGECVCMWGFFVCGKSFFLWGSWLGWVFKHMEFYVSKQNFFMLGIWFEQVCLHMRFLFLAKAYFSGILIWVSLEAFGVSILDTSFFLLGFWFGWVKNPNKWTLRVFIHISFLCKSFFVQLIQVC